VVIALFSYFRVLTPKPKYILSKMKSCKRAYEKTRIQVMIALFLLGFKRNRQSKTPKVLGIGSPFVLKFDGTSAHLQASTFWIEVGG
jgi:hypothetical protein